MRRYSMFQAATPRRARSAAIAFIASLLYLARQYPCLLYTSDAADDLLCVDLGGRRIIKKKKKKIKNKRLYIFFFFFFFFFFSSRRRHTRFALVSWARRCV